jgi:YjbE family integral membrane protein
MEALFMLVSVVLLDIILSGDNAIVIAAVANHVAAQQRSTAINAGMAGAALARVLFLFLAVFLLSFPWLAKIGGIGLIVIAIKLAVDIVRGGDASGGPTRRPTRLWAAILTIILADVSLSFDNVMSVAGLARHNAGIMVLGMLVSIALLTKATHWIALLLLRYPWLNWGGVGLILVAAYRLLV